MNHERQLDAGAEAVGRLEAVMAAHLGLALAAQRESANYEGAELRTVRILKAGGFTQYEIAALLGISQSTVSRRLSE